MISGAKKGDIILVEFTNNRIRRVRLSEVKTHGIEGNIIEIKTNPLKFFPFHNIISIELKENYDN